MRKVFAVCYMEYCNDGNNEVIRGLFETKELAEAYIKEKTKPTNSGLIAAPDFDFYINEMNLFNRIPTIRED